MWSFYIFNSNMRDWIKFVDKVIILSVILVVLLLAMNQLYMSFVLKEKNIYRNQEQFEFYKEHYDMKILFFGDSLPVHDVDPRQIPGSFNLATPGESLEQTYYKVKWVIENEPSVDIFVLEYNYHLFNYDRIKPYYDYKYWKNFMSYDELSEITNITKSNLYIKISIPVIGKGEESYQFFTNKKPKTVILNGWFMEDGNFVTGGRNMTLVGETRAYNQFKNYPEVRDEKLVKIFLRTIKLLEDNNKTIVFVKYPLTDVYLSPLERDVNITEKYKDINERIKNHIVLDYRELLRYNQTLFIDSDHLNIEGSKKFSHNMEQALEKEVFKNKHIRILMTKSQSFLK